jgi:hypothetical protein
MLESYPGIMLEDIKVVPRRLEGCKKALPLV